MFTHSLNVKSFLFQTIQSCIRTLLSSIWPIDNPYQVLPLRARMNLEAMAIKSYAHSPKFQYYWGLSVSWLVSYPGHSLGDLTPLKRNSRYIQQPQPTEPRTPRHSIKIMSASLVDPDYDKPVALIYFGLFNGISTPYESFNIEI